LNEISKEELKKLEAVKKDLLDKLK